MIEAGSDDLHGLRKELDDLAARQAEEIARLRGRLAELEMNERSPAQPPPPPLPKPDPGIKASRPGLTPPVWPPPTLELKSAPAFTPPKVQPRVPKPVRSKPVEPETVEAPPVVVESKGSFELRFGRVWLVRLGIVLLVTGLVLLGNYAYQNWVRDLPAGVRLAFLFAGSFGMIGSGWWFTLKESMRRFGEVILAGGLAFFYWCAFASHHVERLKVVDSPVLGGLLLLGAAAAIVGVSLKRDARSTAVLGLLLASYSTVLQPLGWLSVVSNVVLSLAAVLLMRRPGWSGPGVAGMAGTYLSFLWLQLGGASGGPVSPLALFFLPASWATFALPGVAGLPGGFGRSLSERGRAWFTGVNNGVFFGLFSLLWQSLGYEGYWQVPAVFGLVLIGVGAVTRSRGRSGSVHLAQGLALLTLAFVLKLEGFQLALALAIEGVLMAGAFLRFRKPTELVFSVIAQFGAFGLFLSDPRLEWSSWVGILLIFLAAIVVRMGRVRLEGNDELKEAALLASRFGLGLATSLVIIWCLRIDARWVGLVPVALSTGLSVLALKVDRKGWLPELRFIGMVLGVFGAALLVILMDETPSWAWLTCSLFAGASAVLWEKELGLQSPLKELSRSMAQAMPWLSGLTATYSLGWAVESLGWGDGSTLLVSSILTPGLVFIAMQVMRCPRFRVSLSLLLLLPLLLVFDLDRGDELWAFAVPLAAFGSWFLARMGPVLHSPSDHLFEVVTRSVMLFAWLVAWVINLPGGWIEVIAFSGAAMLLWKGRLGGLRFPESWVLLGLSGVGLLGQLAGANWSGGSFSQIPSGWGVVASFVAVAIHGRTSRDKSINLTLSWISASMLVLWTTLTVIQVTGWKPVVLLWSLLGFGMVCSGLWLRFSAWRHVGFLLFGVSLIKLFAVDVWDYAAFTRVLAFLALGVALVVLGFFYNRFADILKRLLEGEETPGLKDHSGA